MKKGLSPHRERFAQEIASGKNQSDAYRSVYDVSKYKPESIYSKSAQLMYDAKVVQRIDELKAELAKLQIWKREDSVRELKKIVESKAVGDDGIERTEAKNNDIISAIKELNAMHGFNAPIKHDITGDIVHEIRRTIVNP